MKKKNTEFLADYLNLLGPSHHPILGNLATGGKNKNLVF
jgi:hypothetical protein